MTTSEGRDGGESRYTDVQWTNCCAQRPQVKRHERDHTDKHGVNERVR